MLGYADGRVYGRPLSHRVDPSPPVGDDRIWWTDPLGAVAVRPFCDSARHESAKPQARNGLACPGRSPGEVRSASPTVALPLAMAAVAVALTVLGTSVVAVGVLLAAWGLFSTAAPVGWWTWLSKVLPDDAEAGGGLMVAVIQLAIALGATLGGALFDASGYRVTFAVAAAALCASALVAATGRRGGR